MKDRRVSEITYHPSAIAEVDELSHSILDMATSIEKHEQEQRDLMESFIQLIADAINQKFHTGGRCARILVLALILADATNTFKSPVFQAFFLRQTPEQIDGINIQLYLPITDTQSS